MKLFVFGGNRFMGKLLVKELIKLGFRNVTLFNRSGTGPSGTNIIQGDRNNPKDIKKINFKEYDYIFDMCLFKPKQYKLIEKYLIESNLKKYIFMSSAAVGNSDFGKYSLEKEQVENLIKKSNLNYTILRPVYVVGEGSHRPRLGYFINQILNKKPISIEGNGESLINLVQVSDVVKLIKSSMSKYDNETVIISNGENLSIKDIIFNISKFLNNPSYSITTNGESPFINTEFIFNKTHDDFKQLKDILPNYYKWLKTKGNEQYGY